MTQKLIKLKRKQLIMIMMNILLLKNSIEAFGKEKGYYWTRKKSDFDGKLINLNKKVT